VLIAKLEELRFSLFAKQFSVMKNIGEVFSWKGFYLLFVSRFLPLKSELKNFLNFAKSLKVVRK